MDVLAAPAIYVQVREKVVDAPIRKLVVGEGDHAGERGEARYSQYDKERTRNHPVVPGDLRLGPGNEALAKRGHKR